MAKTATKIHHHVFAGLLAVGIALFFGLIVYPKVAYERGEEGVPGNPENFTAEARGEDTIYLAWESPRDEGASSIQEYRAYYTVDGGREEALNGIRADNYLIERLSAGEYAIYITAVNNEGESNPTDTLSVTLGRGGEELAISTEPTVTTNSNSATIEWGTNIVASSQVYYGPLEDFYGETQEYNTSSRITTHEVTIPNLVSCTNYWYKALSFDAEGNFVESMGGEFRTLGCKGDSEIVSVDTRKVTESAGATITASASGRSIEVQAPAALKSGVSEVAITAMKLEKESVETELSAPSGKLFAGDQVYSLKAFEDATTEIEEEFDQPVEVTIDYVADDVVGLDENSLRIWHYTDGTGWEVLTNCSNTFNGSTGTITCETTSFSIFGLFGEEESGTTYGSAPSKPKPVAVETTPIPTPVPVVTEPLVEEDKPSVNNSLITKNLSYGLIDVEVKMLQQALNSLGFTLATNGAGAPGQETEYFGPLTRAALMKFQEVYKNEILAPLGIMNPTGFFGENTRAKLNELISS